jgi:F-type H+-transporting ATPase subunit epsilon
MPKFRCKVATPTAQLFSGDIDYANIPGVEGNFGVLSNHEQFVGLTRSGVLKLTIDEAAGETKSFAVYRGVAQVFNNHLTVLALMGRPLDEIDIADTKEKLEAAKIELEAAQQSDEKGSVSQEKTRTDYIEWCELQIKLAQGEII